MNSVVSVDKLEKRLRKARKANKALIIELYALYDEIKEYYNLCEDLQCKIEDLEKINSDLLSDISRELDEENS